MPHQCTNCGRTFADGSKEMLSGCPDCGGNKFQFAPPTAAAESSTGSADSGAGDTASPPAEAPASESDSVTTRAAETVRDWVSAESSPGSDDSSTTPEGGFDEWPETARRPADRAGSSEETANDSSSETEADDRAEFDGSDDRAEAEWSTRSDRETTATMATDENSAQADARSDVVPTDDLPSHAGDADGSDDADGRDDTDQPPEHGRVVSEPSGQRPSIEELRAELNEQFESIKIVRPGQYELNLMELYNRDEYIISLQEDGRYVIDVPDSWHGDDGDE
ncbi:OapC/ArvC family zinc-ribbon domain-containing protein [Natrinema longum]|uniref:Zn-ribbon containing protein n=1 Tax=Natrinema longum TaxID=370324 RepID=A0A8A2U459_9EURY|nr:Zn-ribbon containing protein [Natrinema longum]MBZ6495029.1 hypothetical protein [Natrinema longum]QSW83676.1 hypothetical protein J0X27_09280 [Natrinema longum]